MGLLTKKPKADAEVLAEEITVESLQTELATAQSTIAELTTKNTELSEELSVFTTKEKVTAKAESLGVVIENMDDFMATNTSYEAQLEALVDMRAEQIKTNSDEFLKSAPETVGEGLDAEELMAEGGDDFAPKTQKEALEYMKAERPELTARERQTECIKLYPKLWEK